jgi:anthranilate synthase/aminodeoxychorismate synthase-like glutamine amidotransferase
MKLIMIDNFDSFTYNLVQYFGELGADLTVYRNNAVTLSDIKALQPHGIVLSPGPGTPDSAGITLSIIREFHQYFPILGVCLGHQAIGQAFGGKVVSAPFLMHGKTSDIWHNGEGLFTNLPSPFQAMRYHSLIVERKTLPACLKVTAETSDGIIMGLQHEHFPVYGVQFHPESFLTKYGKLILGNFMRMIKTV